MNESTSLLHRPGFRMVCMVLGAALLTIGTCSALNKASNEGWEGPSSQPGAAHRTSR